MKTLSMLMLASIAVVATLNPARAADDTPLATAAHLTVEQARDLYSGKSWRWSDGAAYFSPDRKFVAWTGSGETASYATGHWRVTSLGRLCFDALWYSTAPVARVTTCFSHRIDGETLYQAKEPAGPWYVFRHTPVQPTDEFLKLELGDQVTASYNEIKSQLRGR